MCFYFGLYSIHSMMALFLTTLLLFEKAYSLSEGTPFL